MEWITNGLNGSDFSKEAGKVPSFKRNVRWDIFPKKLNLDKGTTLWNNFCFSFLFGQYILKWLVKLRYFRKLFRLSETISIDHHCAILLLFIYWFNLALPCCNQNRCLLFRFSGVLTEIHGKEQRKPRQLKN